MSEKIFTAITFFQKKKDITLYRATDGQRRYLLKSIITKDAAVKQAFYDEYETLSTLRHPSIPSYYWLEEDYLLPGKQTGALTLCMEDCSRPAPEAPLSMKALCHILAKTGNVLSYLLAHGVLYTDLNPSNLIIYRKAEQPTPSFSHADGLLLSSHPEHNDLINIRETHTKADLSVTLVDYTYCYYFLRNPHPLYPLRFSYDVSPKLKGQQFLIQALTYLLYDLLEANHIEELSSPVYQLLETGRNPSDELSLDDFTAMLRHCGYPD